MARARVARPGKRTVRLSGLAWRRRRCTKMDVLARSGLGTRREYTRVQLEYSPTRTRLAIFFRELYSTRLDSTQRRARTARMAEQEEGEEQLFADAADALPARPARRIDR